MDVNEQQTYRCELTWDEIDDLQASQRERIYRIESELKAGKWGTEPTTVAEWDQCTAELWRQVHKLGDARRVAHGYAPVLGDVSFDDLLSAD